MPSSISDPIMMQNCGGGAGSLRRDWGEVAGNSQVMMMVMMVMNMMAGNSQVWI